MKFWIIAPWIDPAEMAELAQFAEQLGFDGMMGADHAFVPRTMAPHYPYTADGKPFITGDLYYPDAMITCAAMLMKTTSLLVSTAVYILPLRHPIDVARMSAALATISDNRFVLSIGVGWMLEEFEVMGVPYKERGRRADESIEVMHKLWQGGYVEHQGKYYQFPQLQLAPAPDKAPPIIVGGSSEAALKRAVCRGDGWLGTGNSLSETHQLLDRIGELRQQFQRQGPFDVIVTPSEAVNFEQMQILQEKGTTGISFGFSYEEKANNFATRKRAMELYAEQVIRPWRELENDRT